MREPNVTVEHYGSTVPKREPMPNPKGQGVWRGGQPQCLHCNGRGWFKGIEVVKTEEFEGKTLTQVDREPERVVCPDCMGTGLA